MPESGVPGPFLRPAWNRLTPFWRVSNTGPGKPWVTGAALVCRAATRCCAGLRWAVTHEPVAATHAPGAPASVFDAVIPGGHSAPDCDESLLATTVPGAATTVPSASTVVVVPSASTVVVVPFGNTVV